MARRQEVINVVLAQLLQGRGLIAAPEEIKKAAAGSREMPDVLVDFQGLRLAIEGEFVMGASPNAAQRKALKAALARVEQGIAHVGVAVVYPTTLRTIEFTELSAKLSSETLRFAIVTESAVTAQLGLFPEDEELAGEIPFVEGDVDALGEALRRAYDQLVKDEVLERAVGLLEQSIRWFMGAITAQPAATDRCAKALGIRELPKVGATNKAKMEDENEAESDE